jgi:hypothetical protein
VAPTIGDPAARPGPTASAIGPVVREVLEDRGVPIDIIPDEPFVMKRLTAAIAAAIGR